MMQGSPEVTCSPSLPCVLLIYSHLFASVQSFLYRLPMALRAQSKMPFSGGWTMYSEKITLEPVEKRVEKELGRELTPREKFYLALAEACTPSSDRSQDVEYQKAG
jgi:hypothetical protein